MQARETPTTMAQMTGSSANGLARSEWPLESSSDPATTAATSSSPASTMPTTHQTRLPVPHSSDETTAASTHATTVAHVEGTESMADTMAWAFGPNTTEA